MARNNRELSQLAAYIGIEDHTQEIDLGASYQFNQVLAIGASAYTGLEQNPAVGIGTTDITKFFQVVSSNGSLFSKDAEGNGGGVEIEGEIRVEGIGSFGSTVNITAGEYDPAPQDTDALTIPLGATNIGGNILIDTDVQSGVGIGTTHISLAINNASISIGNSSGGILESAIPLSINGGGDLSTGGLNTRDALNVGGGQIKLQGPVRITDGGLPEADRVSSSIDSGLVTVAGGIGIAGTVYQADGNIRTNGIIINDNGEIFVPSAAAGPGLIVQSGVRFNEGPCEIGDIYISGGPVGLSTFQNLVFIDNNQKAFDFTSIGVTGSNAPALQVSGGGIFGDNLHVVNELMTTGLVSCRDFEVAPTPLDGGTTLIRSTSIDLGNPGEVIGVSTHIIRFNTQVDSAIVPTVDSAYNLGDPSYKWFSVYTNEISANSVAINTEAVINNLSVSGIATFTGSLYHSGVPGSVIFYNGVDIQNDSTIDTVTIRQLTAIEDILGTATTSLRAKAIDVGTATTDQYYQVMLTDSTGGTIENSVFVDDGSAGGDGELGLRYNPFTDNLLIGGNLYVDGAGSEDLVISMDPSSLTSKNLKFFENGINTIEMFSNDQRSLSIGSTIGVSTINTYLTSVRGDILLGAIGITTAAIKDVNGLENITINGNTLTEFANDIAMDGSTFDVRNATFNLCNSNSTTINAFELGDQITIGSPVGFTSFRNPIVRFEGDIRVDGNAIQASDGQENIIMTGADLTRFSGDIQVDGNDIRVAGGVTNITMVTNLNTIFAGDIQVNGDEIRGSDGTLNISLAPSLTSIAGTLRVEGNSIQSGAGITNITLDTNYTQIERDLRVNGDNIRASDNSVNITMDGSANTTVAGDITIGSNNINAADQTTSITVESGGNAGIVSTLTVNGNLIVKGDDFNVLSADVKFKDRLLELGLGISTISPFTDLVIPTSDENKDVGLVLNYYDVSAKKAAIFWDDSLGSIGIASDVSESSEVLSINQYAKLVAKSITISDCAGTSDIVECADSTRTLVNITIDGGEY